MFKYIALSAVISSTAVAGESANYGFTATSRTDPVFMGKCVIWRDALQRTDMNLLTSFVEPAFLAKRRVASEKELAKMSEKFRKRTGIDSYELLSMRFALGKDINFVNIDTQWEARDKRKQGNGGCSYAALGGGKWELMLVYF